MENFSAKLSEDKNLKAKDLCGAHMCFQTFMCAHMGRFCMTGKWPNTIRKSSELPVPAKPNVLYSRGRFVDMVCWTVG